MRYVHYYSYTLTYGTPVTVPVYRIVFVRLCGIPNFDSVSEGGDLIEFPFATLPTSLPSLLSHSRAVAYHTSM